MEALNVSLNIALRALVNRILYTFMGKEKEKELNEFLLSKRVTQILSHLNLQFIHWLPVLEVFGFYTFNQLQLVTSVCCRFECAKGMSLELFIFIFIFIFFNTTKFYTNI